MNDLKFALRQLRNNPGFAAVAILTLALGIGANTAIFSVVDAVLLKNLPVKRPEELVALEHAGGGQSGNGFSYPVFERLRARNSAFADLFAFASLPELTLSRNGQDEPVPGGVLMVSDSYYATLGVSPVLGRLIGPEDNRAIDGPPVAVLSYGYWQRKFGGDAAVIGQTVSFNGVAFTIIGVTPPEFFGVRVGRTDAVTIPSVMLPRLEPGAPALRDPANWYVEVVGRLKPTVSLAPAVASLRVLFPQIEAEQLGAAASEETRRLTLDRRIELVPISKGLSELRRQFSEPLRILMAVVGVVLLIAGANVANLLLARAAARRQEIAIRLALGASRWRLIRQLLTESLLLAVLAGTAGLFLANWLSAFCVALIPGQSEATALNLTLDRRLLAFTAGASILTGIAFGLAPALRATSVNLATPLKSGGGNIGGRGPRAWLGDGLVAGQVALSLVLLVTAGLFVRTFQNLQSQAPGFNPKNVLLFSFDSRMRGGSTAPDFEIFRRLLKLLNESPGVSAATVSRDGNFGGGSRTRTTIRVEGYVAQGDGDADVFDVLTGPRFFQTLGMAVTRGRDFTLADDERAPKVAVLNETAARHFFGGENPIGRRIGADTTIVGVVADAKLNSLRETPQRVMFRSFFQVGAPRTMTFAVRAAVPPLTLVAGLRREIERTEPNLPLFNFRVLDAVVAQSLAQERWFAALSGAFGLLAFALATVGLYGVMAYSVGRREKEIGLRMALGARRINVVELIVRKAMSVVVGGLAAGFLFAFAALKLIASHLYGVSAGDPAVALGAAAALVGAAALASFLPARRASRVDPLVALRQD